MMTITKITNIGNKNLLQGRRYRFRIRAMMLFFASFSAMEK